MTVSNQKDIRVTIISRIWAYATAMLLISILFSGRGRDWKVIFLPTTIAFGAAISTIVVWGKSRYHRHDDPLFPSESLEEFKRRIENLEAIAASDYVKPWESSPKQLEQSTIESH
jgi:hypothetical protein